MVISKSEHLYLYRQDPIKKGGEWGYAKPQAFDWLMVEKGAWFLLLSSLPLKETNLK